MWYFNFSVRLKKAGGAEASTASRGCSPQTSSKNWMQQETSRSPTARQQMRPVRVAETYWREPCCVYTRRECKQVLLSDWLICSLACWNTAQFLFFFLNPVCLQIYFNYRLNFEGLKLSFHSIATSTGSATCESGLLYTFLYFRL